MGQEYRSIKYGATIESVSKKFEGNAKLIKRADKYWYIYAGNILSDTEKSIAHSVIYVKEPALMGGFGFMIFYFNEEGKYIRKYIDE